MIEDNIKKKLNQKEIDYIDNSWRSLNITMYWLSLLCASIGFFAGYIIWGVILK